VTVTIYHNPDCATSRDVLALIRNSGEEPRIIEYLKAPPSREEFVELLRRMDLPLRAVLRRKGTPYDELGLDDPRWDDDRLVELRAAEQKSLRKRPGSPVAAVRNWSAA
jgi:arsenate reductase